MNQIEKQKIERPLKKALIICNGNPPPQALLKQLWHEADYRVAADGGANLLHFLNLLPDAVVGDFPQQEDGFLPLPQGPGLGISIDEDWVAANPWDDSAIWTYPPAVIPPRQQVAWP